MNDLSVAKPYQHRRRFSQEFKAQIVAQCLEPGASVSRISLDNVIKHSSAKNMTLNQDAGQNETR